MARVQIEYGEATYMSESVSGSRALGLTIGLAVLVALMLVAPSAHADQIAYSCEQDICLINPDNTAEHKNLTESGTAADVAPSWSPDGNLIAMIGDYLGSFDVFTIDPTKAGTAQEATAISETPDQQAERWPPAWSPDGTRIAFAEHSNSNVEPDHENELYVAPRDGTSDPVTIDSTVKQSELTPAWAPAGSTLVFSRAGLLWTGPPDNSVKPTALTNSYGYEPAWSPDGSRIATVTFSDPEHIRVTNADGSGYKELPVPADLGSIVDWSPDSTQIVYSADEEPIDRIRVAPADGSGPGHAIEMPKDWVVPYHASFSPDGTRIAFDAYPLTGDTHRQILVAPADGSSPAVPITTSSEQNEEPDWKPCDGCAPPAKPQIPVTTPGAEQAAKAPTTVRTVAYKHVYVYPRMAVFIDCFAEGGHPDPKYCTSDGIAKAVAPAGNRFRPWAKPKSKKTIVFAKGSLKVPGGESGEMKLKVTPAGKKLAKPGKTLTVQLVVKVSRDQEKPETFKNTIKVKVPKKKK